MSFQSLLQAPLSSFNFPQKPIVVLKQEDTLKRASEVFSSHQISSAPVLDEKTQKFVGIVDSSDIVSFILDSIYQLTGKTDANQKERLESLEGLEFSTIKSSTLMHRFSSLHVKNFMNHSLRNPYISVSADTPFGYILKQFAAGCQRVIVLKTDTTATSEKDRVLFYLTQSTVLKYLATQVELFKSLAEEKLETHGFGCKPLLSVRENQSALVAFGLMHEFKVSGLPILSQSGVYEAAISVKDISHALVDFSHLSKTVREYAAYARQESLLEISPTVFCNRSDSLSYVIQRLIKMPIHRLFIVDSTTHFAPVGVISYCDVICLLVEKFLH